MNVRGLNTKDKKINVLNLLQLEEIDIAILTETWLKSRADFSDDNFQITLTPPSAHQGVAIALSRKTFAEIKLIH